MRKTAACEILDWKKKNVFDIQSCVSAGKDVSGETWEFTDTANTADIFPYLCWIKNECIFAHCVSLFSVCFTLTVLII